MAPPPTTAAFAAERAGRPAVMPRKVSGHAVKNQPAAPSRRVVRDKDFLQRLRESGL